MLCLACASIGHPLCDLCLKGLRRAPFVVVGEIPVHAAFIHTGSAARLVHNLKYRRSAAAGRFLAMEMASRIPHGIDALVPIPRVISRRVVHGIDQTAALSESLSLLTGIPVVKALAAPFWHRRLAGAIREGRVAPTFRLRAPVRGHVCVVDDVCTSGSTVVSAVSALQCENVVAVVATLARDQRSVPAGRDPSEPTVVPALPTCPSWAL
jgi:predicted amidophosphoribosyltransferase